MKKQKTAIIITALLLVTALAGCRHTPTIREKYNVPEQIAQFMQLAVDASVDIEEEFVSSRVIADSAHYEALREQLFPASDRITVYADRFGEDTIDLELDDDFFETRCFLYVRGYKAGVREKNDTPFDPSHPKKWSQYYRFAFEYVSNIVQEENHLTVTLFGWRAPLLGDQKPSTVGSMVRGLIPLDKSRLSDDPIDRIYVDYIDVRFDSWADFHAYEAESA